MSTPTDDGWPHVYQQNLSNQDPVFGDQRYATTVVTTTVNPSAAGSSGGHLSTPEGRVGKPARKRSRASRRTPTTLLNTDPTNFRAMVQQFTGGPTFAPGSAGPAFGFSFGGRQGQPHLNPGSLTVHPVEFQLQYQQQQQQLMQHQNQGYMFSLNTNDDNVGAGRGDHLVQRLGGNVEAGSEGLGVSSQVPASRTGSTNENRSRTSFMF
ncbi:hypothetical protein V6N13_067871 [Hibiscus sabdariffa]|uniref:VQ domain-containing protein n=1 Tax=Hibiscus sabdariffa TaxID=183260 RepID=A0ABR2DY36_9ROSI